jgi:hypothetical protein
LRLKRNPCRFNDFYFAPQTSIKSLSQ